MRSCQAGRSLCLRDWVSVGACGAYTDLQVKYTSNYVARINTALTTAIGLKQDVLTTTNLFTKFNTTDFVVSDDKIRINKTLELG